MKTDWQKLVELKELCLKKFKIKSYEEYLEYNFFDGKLYKHSLEADRHGEYIQCVFHVGYFTINFYSGGKRFSIYYSLENEIEFNDFCDIDRQRKFTETSQNIDDVYSNSVMKLRKDLKELGEDFNFWIDFLTSQIKKAKLNEP